MSDRARVECQSHKLTVEDPVTVEYITRYIAQLKQANTIGRSAKTVREFLEKHYTDDVAASERETIKLALKALLEVVQSGAKNMEVAVMRRGQALQMMESDEIEKYITEIEKEREEEAEKKKQKK
nr:hypothetical protein BaRGS_021794 [Batillaria attramentaria]